MILKRKRIKLGKQIRRATGIKLNEAIYLAKKILKGNSLARISSSEDRFLNIKVHKHCEQCDPVDHCIFGCEGAIFQEDIDKLVNELG
jgi:hypothetical protein